MRIHFHALTRFRHFNRIQHLHRLFKGFGFSQTFMQHQNFHQLLTHPHIRVQGGHRVLEYHGNLFGAKLIQIALRQIENLTAVKQSRPANLTVGGQQAH